MNAFIVPLLLFNMDAPFLVFQMTGTYNEQYVEIESDSLEVQIDFYMYVFLEHEIGLDDIYTIFEEDIEIEHRYNLDLENNYNEDYIARIQTDIYFDNIQYVQSYDSATITLDYTIETYARDRENNTMGYKYIEDRLVLSKEMNFDITYNASFPPLYYQVILQKEIRGFSHDEIYQEGYNDGYHDGEQEGYENGYYDGYDEGEYYGSMTQPIFRLFNAVFRTIDSVLQTEILPGIKLWYIVSIPLVFLIIQFFINLWR